MVIIAKESFIIYERVPSTIDETKRPSTHLLRRVIEEMDRKWLFSPSSTHLDTVTKQPK